ncbi:hypothetical protein [Kamptonema formosum]|uniref:hypothetical protein n=1 Tax=Kamptonema formosum TaxID=331992 RepID=UPI0012DE3616|nr:hypothetical protein [Oscillatoria sp. PCC 10802]
MKAGIILSAFCLLALSASASAASPNTSKLKCIGTEPFWGVEVEGNMVQFSTPEFSGNKAKKYWGAQVTTARGAMENTAFQVRASRNSGAEKIVLSVIRAANNSCIDGMSDNKYSHHVLVSLENGTLYRGCCQNK